MAQKRKSSVKVDPLVGEPLRSLQAALQRDFGVSATQEQIVGALILGTPPAQTVGMLEAYVKYAAKRAEAEPAEPPGSGSTPS
jgi:hypothetical protein